MIPKIIIAGAGGIGRAVALILLELEGLPCKIILSDVSEAALDVSEKYILEGCTSDVQIERFLMPFEGSNDTMDTYFDSAQMVLDCLPGSQAPRIAAMAKKYKLHYANLTEYVDETEKVKEIAHGSNQAFILQTGLAPGFINVLACKLYEEFVEKYKVEVVEKIEMKVGALSKHAKSPHYYAFTWSPIGVATEYLRDAYIVRNYKKIKVSPLSWRKQIIIDGDEYEDNFTSGGAADLPEALAGKVRDLDYKTLRYPGHYQWVETALSTIPHDVDAIKYLEQIMLANIPSVEEDVVIIYASVTAKDKNGRLRQIEKSYNIMPKKIGNQTLRAIQATTAAPMCEIARMAFTKNWKGPILQSQINTTEFLNGPFVSKIYGAYKE